MAPPRKTAKKTTKSRTASPRRAPARAKPAKAKAPARPAPRTLTPYLAVTNADEAIGWYKKALGAKLTERNPSPDGKVMHAELRLGDSSFYLSDIFPGSDMADATRTGPTVNMHVTSRNIDKLWQSATQNGAKVTMPLEDQFWGDRYGRIIDPFGHSWAFSWKSKLNKAQLEARRVEAMKQFGQQ